MGVDILHNVSVRRHAGEVRDAIRVSRTSSRLVSVVENIIRPTVARLMPIVFPPGMPAIGRILGEVAQRTIRTVRAGMDWARQWYGRGEQAGQPPSLPSIPEPIRSEIESRTGWDVSTPGILTIGGVSPDLGPEKPPYDIVEEGTAVPIQAMTSGPMTPGVLDNIKTDYEEFGEVVSRYLIEKGPWAGWEVQVTSSGRRAMVPVGFEAVSMNRFVPFFSIILE